jgi:hypothetical protein
MTQENCPITVTPFAQSVGISNRPFVSLNYTNQDFWSMKTRLVEFINERFGDNGTELPNTFNDLVESSIAIMLIENWAFLADTLSFKIDQMVNELFIDTVTEPDNAFRLSRLVGFKPTPPIPARTLWTATSNNVLNNDVIIPTPVIVDVASDTEPITIELFAADSDNNPQFDEDIVIPAGAVVNSSIVGLEGRTVTDSLESNGAVSQIYELRRSPVIYDSIEVKVDGVIWEQVDFFTDSQPRREYRVEFDSSYTSFVIFGNNRAGLIPSRGSQISIQYRVGGGTNGNIVAGFVSTQRQANVFGLEFSVPVEFNNYTKGEFGYNGDTIEDVRRKLPAYLRTQNRAVTGHDYKTLTDQFVTPFHGQIGKSTAVLRNHGCAGNLIDLYILAKEGENGLTLASDELKADLSEELDQKKMLTDIICVKNGQVVVVDVSIEATVPRINRKFEAEIRQRLTSRIDSFFDLNNWEYDQNLLEADLIKELADVKEVSGFDMTFTTDDEDNSGNLVTTRFFEIIRPDEIDLAFTYV